MGPQAKLFQQLRKCGYRGRVVMIHRLQDLQEDIESQHREGLLEEAFFRERLAEFVFRPPESLSAPRSLILVA
ncbi:MAG: hypothetical protein FJY85_08695, partial [Deltaproteobacteria bacterium]|nr:hypothetical protein [Deltaproteobacteria bacterium]